MWAVQDVRTIVVTIISGTVAWILNLLGMYVGLSEKQSSIIAFYIFGSLIAYVLDIVLVKDVFGTVNIPLSDLAYRFNWLLRSFITPVFLRFIMTILLDTIIGMSILTYVLQLLDRYNIHFGMRDTICSAMVAVFTFFLYNNTLRFAWAYNEEYNPLLDIVVLAWVTLALMIFTTKRQ